MKWVQIPTDVIVWFREAFAEANRSVTETLLNVPNIREPSLDDAFIQSLVPRSAPTLLASGAIVRMDIHNIGGLRRAHHWEIADIGIVVFVIRAGKIMARKIALLQAKRLYPANKVVEDDDAVGFAYGFNALLRPDHSPTSMVLSRRFDFSDECLYGAIAANSDQVKAIEGWAKRSGNTVEYLLYNPPTIPLTVLYPVASRQSVAQAPPMGCRVISMNAMHDALSMLPKGSSPSLSHLQTHTVGREWRVENWASDLLLTCQAGRPYDVNDEDAILPIIERRSGPIGAAIAINIELPVE